MLFFINHNAITGDLSDIFSTLSKKLYTLLRSAELVPGSLTLLLSSRLAENTQQINWFTKQENKSSFNDKKHFHARKQSYYYRLGSQYSNIKKLQKY